MAGPALISGDYRAMLTHKNLSLDREKDSGNMHAMNKFNVGEKVFGPGRYFGYGIGIVDGIVLTVVDERHVRIKLWNGEIQTANTDIIWK